MTPFERRDTVANKLPWFKFYVLDFITDNRVLKLTNEQRGVYLWLLCRQWNDGALPYDVHDIYPLLPPGSESAAVAYVLTTFFPPDPDTNERRNTKLAEQQEERSSAYRSRVKSAGKARKARAHKSLQDNGVSGDQTGDQPENQNQNQKQIVETTSDSEEAVDFITRCVVLVNQLHPQVGLEGYRNPLTASKARSIVQGWVEAGIPENVILERLQRVLERVPKDQHISSFRYFDRAVREANEKPSGDALSEVLRQMEAGK